LFSAAEARADDAIEAAAPPTPSDWGVSALNTAARRLIEGAFRAVWVVGEVTNFTRARSGHCYFTLRDDSSQLRCVMWRDEARRLPTAPEEGMEVRVLGRLTLYEARGEFQLVVSELEGQGEGLWKLALERLRARLEAEGLTAPERKRRLPRCPAAIGVVTSPSGAVLHDIVTVVRRRAPWTRVILRGCRVQGDGAAEEIAEAIRLFGRVGCADVLIVGRGGGSIEDLWAFNEEVVARAIAESPIPVISAVGHETDITIADLVADLRAPTPSAAAEAAVPDMAALARELGIAQARMAAAVDWHVEDGRRRLADCGVDMAAALVRRLAARRDRTASLARQIHALSPLAALARGYALPIGPDGRVMRHRAAFDHDLPFDLMIRDGRVPCRVTSEGS
jgi:exodeoxyribonuclease VII large subunit